MGADPPAIAGFGGAALSAGLSDMVAGSVVGAVSMDSCLISDIRARQVRLLRARNLAKGNPKENSEAEERKAYAETARSLKRHSETEVRKTILAETTSTYLTGVALRTV
jgi:hypothetical protein